MTSLAIKLLNLTFFSIYVVLFPKTLLHLKNQNLF